MPLVKVQNMSINRLPQSQANPFLMTIYTRHQKKHTFSKVFASRDPSCNIVNTPENNLQIKKKILPPGVHKSSNPMRMMAHNF